jgi:hypothetical protein
LSLEILPEEREKPRRSYKAKHEGRADTAELIVYTLKAGKKSEKPPYSDCC